MCRNFVSQGNNIISQLFGYKRETEICRRQYGGHFGHERERYDGGRGTTSMSLVSAPGAMYVFKYVYTHEITSRGYVCNWLARPKSMCVCTEILVSSTGLLELYIYIVYR